MLIYYKRAKSIIEQVRVKDWTELGTSLISLEAMFLDIVMKLFMKSISKIDIKRLAA